MKFIPVLIYFLILFVSLQGCGGSGDNNEVITGEMATNNRVIERVSIEDGNNQTAMVGTELLNPLVAQILNSDEQAIAGQIVNFRVINGDGSVFAGSAISDEQGYVREIWTLGAVAGIQTVEVRAVDTSGVAVVFATFNANAVAGEVNTIQVSSGDYQTASQLQLLPLPIEVIAQDIYGNPKSGVTVMFSANNDGSAIPSSADTNELGMAQSLWTLGRVAGGQTLTASVDGFSPLTFNATATLDITSPPQNIEIVSGDSQTVAQNSLVDRFVVRVTNELGNPVSTLVTFSATTATGEAYLSPVTVGTTDGVARTYYLVISSIIEVEGGMARFPDAGEYLVYASVEGVIPAVFNITVTPSTLYLYDGSYVCTGIPSFALTEGEYDGGIFNASVNTENGLFTASLGSNYRQSFNGWLTIDPNNHATGSGTYTASSFAGQSTDPIGNWTCSRE